MNGLTSPMVPRHSHIQSSCHRRPEGSPEVRGLGLDPGTSTPLIAADSDVSRHAESVEALPNNRPFVYFLGVVSTILQFYE